jgi:hypothetical protein
MGHKKQWGINHFHFQTVWERLNYLHNPNSSPSYRIPSLPTHSQIHVQAGLCLLFGSIYKWNVANMKIDICKVPHASALKGHAKCLDIFLFQRYVDLCVSAWTRKVVALSMPCKSTYKENFLILRLTQPNFPMRNHWPKVHLNLKTSPLLSSNSTLLHLNYSKVDLLQHLCQCFTLPFRLETSYRI